MILHPGVIALLVGILVVLSIMAYGSVAALRILKYWNIYSSDELQLNLERKTYLISTIMNYVLGFELISLFLFVYTLDDIHRLFIGAMCATGSLNANPVGWYALYVKIIVFFLSFAWIIINHVDQKGEDYPLIRKKYKLLLLITPMITLEGWLTFRYFLGLKPRIISSCCGSLFSDEGNSVAATLSSIPVYTSMVIFYTVVTIFILVGICSYFFRHGFFKYVYGVLSLVFFVVSIISIISFVSIYYYELPTHHCPFDLLQGTYNFIGYPLYAVLFGAVSFSLAVFLVEGYKKCYKSISLHIEKLQKTWIILSLCFTIMFIVISIWPVLFSDFTPF
ncbi:MAG: hypothetical protein L3V56_01975 [Candidatus Magnetoovum sp. WYHC-5]|nr:hypothetical protein [Candidatus Magnetoovum sp. WYHC-5]